MALFSSRNNGHDLHRDIEALRRDLASLSHSATRRGTDVMRSAADEASGLYDNVTGRITHALPVIRRRAHDLETTIRDNPRRAAAAAGLAALTLAAAVFIFGNRRR